MGSTFRLGRPTEKARTLRNEATEAEQALWQKLKASQLNGLKFSRQMPIGGYICDFVCRSHRFVIELDGSQHHDQSEYDALRTQKLNALGYRVIRFWNSEVSGNIAGVLEMILSVTQTIEREPTPRPPPASGRGSEGA